MAARRQFCTWILAATVHYFFSERAAGVPTRVEGLFASYRLEQPPRGKGKYRSGLRNARVHKHSQYQGIDFPLGGQSGECCTSRRNDPYQSGQQFAVIFVIFQEMFGRR
jgi:hypothetical protein